MPTRKVSVPVKVIAQAKRVASPKSVSKPVTQDKKAKLVAALKRLHPMD